MPRSRSWRYWLLFAVVTLWQLLILLPPFVGSHHAGLSTLLYHPFSALCHQISDRSLHLYGFPLAVCARCSGLYFGFWLGLLIIPSLKVLSARLVRSPRLMLLFAVPMGVDLLIGNTAFSRFFTGALSTFVVPLFVWLAVEQLPVHSPGSRRRIG